MLKQKRSLESVKVRSVFVFFLVLISLPKEALGYRQDGLDKTQWYVCLDQNECEDVASGFGKKIMRGSRREDEISAYLLSSLLAVYLRPKGEALDLAGMEKIRETADTLKNHYSKAIIHAFISIVFAEYETAKEYLYDLPPDGLSFKIVSAVLLERTGDEDYVKLIADLPEEDFVPFLALNYSEKMILQADCRTAVKHLTQLIKRYRNNQRLLATWAEAQMDCGDYSNKIISTLKKVYKKNPAFSPLIAAQMIRFLNHHSQGQEIENLIRGINIDAVSGRGVSALLTQIAEYRLAKRQLSEAAILAERAVYLDSLNARAYRLLGQINLLNEPKDLKSAIAYLKIYISISGNTADKEQIRLLVERLESHVL